MKAQVDGPAEFPLTLTDAKGKELTLEGPPKRIVSMAPSVTEVLFAIGAGNRVIGVTDYCDYPPEAKDRESIGGFKTPSVEKIVSLTPDLVVAPRGVPDPVIVSMCTHGLPVFAMEHESIDEVLASFGILGGLTGCAREAERIRRGLAARRDAVLAKTRPLRTDQRPKVLYVIGPLDSLFTCGPGSYADDLISAAGGVNVAADAATEWTEYSIEMIVKKDPDVILMTAGPMGGYDTVRKEKLAELKRDERWRNLSAVKSERVLVLNEDHFAVPGPRLVEGLEELAEALHPTLFSATPSTRE